MLAWGRSVFLSVFLSCGIARAESDPCYPNLIRTNVCDIARQLQEAAAPALPMAISREVVLVSVLAFGPRVTLVGMWQYTQAELETLFAQYGMTLADLKKKMDQQAATFACSQETTAAFIELGGEVEYIYRTKDGFNLRDIVLKDCPIHGQ